MPPPENPAVPAHAGVLVTNHVNMRAPVCRSDKSRYQRPYVYAFDKTTLKREPELKNVTIHQAKFEAEGFASTGALVTGCSCIQAVKLCTTAGFASKCVLGNAVLAEASQSQQAALL